MTLPSTQTGSDIPESGVGSLASIAQRSVARLIDLTVFLVFGAIVLTVASRTNDGGIADLAVPIVTIVLTPLIYGVYEAGSTAWRGQTLGKASVGIRVRLKGEDRPPGLARALIRWGFPAILGFVPIAGSPLIFLPYAMTVRDPERRGWHDKAAGTIVVTAR